LLYEGEKKKIDVKIKGGHALDPARKKEKQKNGVVFSY